MIELFTARSGATSLKVDGVAMHSPYDPVREATRFVRQTIGDEPPATVIVLGECAGHITEAIARLWPGVQLIAAVFSADIARAAPFRGAAAWNPGAPLSFAEFLRNQLGELQIEGLRIVEWPPAANAFPAVSRSANEAVRQVVQELNGSFITTVAAGRRWLRNSLANFLHLPTVVSGRLCAPGRPIVVVAPGPSLETAARVLSGIRPGVELWALPSSCAFLKANGLLPDLVVMTDPGFYSMHHLHFDPPPCPLAMPLSAARGAWDLPTGAGRGVPVFLLGQPVIFEKALLAAAGVPAPMVPPRGTVAATAIELALAATTGPVIVAGLDMCSRDLLTHARPSAFERLLHLQSSRFQPHTSLVFHRAAEGGFRAAEGGFRAAEGGFRAVELGSSRDNRAAGMRVSPALRTYAGWFDASPQGQGGRVHRLLPTAVSLAGMGSLDEEDLTRLVQGLPTTRGSTSLAPYPGFPRGDERKRLASGLLAEWMTEVMAARDSTAGGSRAGAGNMADIARFPRVVELAHLLSPRRLVDAMKKSRLGDGAAARGTVEEMLTDCVQVLGGLRERIRA